MEILKLLKKSKVVSNYQVHDFKEFQNGFYIKVVVQLTNNTSLFIREYSDKFERNYSYHLQVYLMF